MKVIGYAGYTAHDHTTSGVMTLSEGVYTFTMRSGEDVYKTTHYTEAEARAAFKDFCNFNRQVLNYHLDAIQLF